MSLKKRNGDSLLVRAVYAGGRGGLRAIGVKRNAGGCSQRLCAAAYGLLLALLIILGSEFRVHYAYANPEEGRVVGGTASIVEASPSRLNVVQQSERAAIDWRSFSIEAHEHVDFQQPSSSAAALNRVTGPQVSDIRGRLTANGQVFLVNPNGVIFGKNAQVDVAGLVATTLNIANEDFMAGRYRFADLDEQSKEPQETSARVINRGRITVAEGGLVALVAPGVANTGVIQARLGRVHLASGEAFTLDLYGDELVSLKVDKAVLKRVVTPEGEPVSALVDQRGEIVADGGTVVLSASTAKEIVDNVINMEGVTRAQTVAEQNGQIVLLGDEDAGAVRVAGTLDARGTESGETGGEVQVLGHEVALADTARIDASGDAGGGNVLVGGDFRGQGEVPTATHTTVDEGARIAADALSEGDGGRVIVWAEETTTYHGNITARGGMASGDGGFAEVSGKAALDFDGEVALDSPNGNPGTLLLDPENLTVGETGSDTLDGDPPTVQAAVVSKTLGDGTNVALDATNDITVSAPIDARFPGAQEGASLEMNAGRDVNIEADILTNEGAIDIAANTGAIRMSALAKRPGSDVVEPVILFAGNESITLRAGKAIDVQHIITTGPVALTSTEGPVTLNQALGGAEEFPLGEFTVTSNQGGVLLKGLQTSGPVTVSAAQLVEVNGPIASGGPVTLQGVNGALTAINLNHNIFTEGHDITFGGNVLIDPTAEELTSSLDLSPSDFFGVVRSFCPTEGCPPRLCPDCSEPDRLGLSIQTMDQFFRYVENDFYDPDRNRIVTGLDVNNDTLADADRRAEALLGLFQAKEVTISTGAGGGNVVFAGDVQRESADALATFGRVFDEAGNRRSEFNGVVFGSFLHQGLVVSAGTGTVRFEGTIGDEASFNVSLSRDRDISLPPVDLESNLNLPVLGSFYLSIPSASQASFEEQVFLNELGFRNEPAVTEGNELAEGVIGNPDTFQIEYPPYRFLTAVISLSDFERLGPTPGEAFGANQGSSFTGISAPTLPGAPSSDPSIIPVAAEATSPDLLTSPEAIQAANRASEEARAPTDIFGQKWHVVQVVNAEVYRGNDYLLLDPFEWAEQVATQAGEEEEQRREQSR